MKLSDVREGGVILIDNEKGIITSRCPEDRSSGVTIVTFESGEQKQFIWDYSDPEVVCLGLGRLDTKIVMARDFRG